MENKQQIIKRNPIIARLLRCGMVIAIAAAFLSVGNEKNNIFSPSPALAFHTGTAHDSIIKGSKIDQSGAVFDFGTTITIDGIGSFNGNPYNSGLIAPGTYTISSSPLAGYGISYSTDPEGGASTYVSGSIATVTVDQGKTLNLWWKYSPTGVIQGYKVDQNGIASSLGTTITISNVGSFAENPYNSGQIPVSTYTISSSRPAGYNVSYSTNPTGGPSTYVSGSIATVTVIAGQTLNLWWKYTPTGIIQGYKVDINGAVSEFGTTIIINNVGSFSGNPYNSGQIGAGIYTVSSSRPAGYNVSYSTNPTGGPSTYVSGSIATVTVIAGQTLNLWWKYTPVLNTIQGYKVDQSGVISSLEAAITIDGVGSFNGNPYNSGQIAPGIYRVSSFQPAGYSVSYSTNPGGGSSTYISGSIATVTIAPGGTVILWWKYTPTFSNIKGYKVDINGAVSNFGATIAISGVGSFTTNPYDSGQIGPGTYAVSSSQLPGYDVSYSTNPEGGASTYTLGLTASVTVTIGRTVNLWWKYVPIITPTTTPPIDIGVIRGSRVDLDGQITPAVPTAVITISNIGSFTGNPYNSGQIAAGSYTVSSSQPTGYSVSYSMNPTGGPSTYVPGSTVDVTVTTIGAVNLWWKYVPIPSIIQGYRVDQNGQVTPSVPAATITIYGIDSFTGNPYSSGRITEGTYTISSAEPSGYHVSHSINPTGGASTYVSGSTVTLTVEPGQTVDLWWKYSLITDLNTFTLELDNLRSSYSPAILSDQETKRMWTGRLTDTFFPAIPNRPNFSTIPRANGIFYSEYINGLWTKPLTERTFTKPGFQINDPSVIKYPGINSLIAMYYTALDNTDAEQKIFDRHSIGLAINSKGQPWIDKGIVVNYAESGDGKGASSPSAIVVGDQIWLYYHTGTSDFSRPINWLIKFDINLSANNNKIAPPERLNLVGFLPNDPNWILYNLDVSYKNSQFVMLANTSDLTKIVRLVSDDGINWRKPAAGPDPMIEIPNYLVLTPTVEDISPDRYKIYFGLGAISGSNVESSMIRSREFSTSASTPISASAFVFTTNITIGDTGDNVRALQTCLKKDSSVYPEGLITGYFGPLTRKAVIRFQEKFAIDATGFVGLLTRNKLNLVCAQ